VYVVTKWPLRGGEVVLCVGISHSKSVVTVQRAFRAKYAKVFVTPLPRDLADLKARIIAAVKNIDAPVLTRVCGKNWNIVSMCAVSHVVHTPISSSCPQKKLFQLFCGCEPFH
jgi:ribosome-binding factor A